MRRRRPSLPHRIKNIPVLLSYPLRTLMIFGKPARSTPPHIFKSLLSKSPKVFVTRSGVIIMSVRVQQDEKLIKKWASPVSFRLSHFCIFKHWFRRLFMFGCLQICPCRDLYRNIWAVNCYDDVFTLSCAITNHWEWFFRSRHVACKP